MSASPSLTTDLPWLAKPRLVKIGLGVCGAGLIAALVGAIGLAQGTTVVQTAANVLHRSGELLMLLGLAIVLVAYRTEWCYRALVKVSGWTASQSRLVALWLGMGGIVLGCLLVPAMLLLPAVLAGLLMFVSAVLLPVVLAALAMVCHKRVRMFCVGALFPAAMPPVAHAVALGLMLNQRLDEIFGLLGDRQLPALLACWALVPVAGLVSVATHWIVTAGWPDQSTR